MKDGVSLTAIGKGYLIRAKFSHSIMVHMAHTNGVALCTVESNLTYIVCIQSSNPKLLDKICL
jgi:hypothetical protein